MPHLTPLELVFSRFTDPVFPAIRKSIEQGGIDPTDRDAFLMLPDAVNLIRELRPEEGIGEGMDYLVALAQHAYLSWAAGSLTLHLAPEEAEALLSPEPASPSDPREAPKAYYAQFLGRQVWAKLVDDEVAEPLDGCFVHSLSGDTLRVLGIFGLRPERVGFTAVETIGPRPDVTARPDGSPLFSSTFATGHLHSLVGSEELLELGWRTLSPAHDAWARAA
ncbi:MAG: hypothetical protein ACREL3_01555 [Gemmatimonadales bacterium]